jgi:hypothetical protein
LPQSSRERERGGREGGSEEAREMWPSKNKEVERESTERKREKEREKERGRERQREGEGEGWMEGGREGGRDRTAGWTTKTKIRNEILAYRVGRLQLVVYEVSPLLPSEVVYKLTPLLPFLGHRGKIHKKTAAVGNEGGDMEMKD